MSDDLIERLEKRAAIRRQIPGRASVNKGEPDRLADLLDEAALALREARARTTSLYEAIAHGDEDHRAWLKAKIEEHFK